MKRVATPLGALVLALLALALLSSPAAPVRHTVFPVLAERGS